MLRVKGKKWSICLSSSLITESPRKCFHFFLHCGNFFVSVFFFLAPVLYLSPFLMFSLPSSPELLFLWKCDYCIMTIFYILPILYSSSLLNHIVLLSSDRSTTWDCICKWELVAFSSVFWFIIPDIMLAKY